MSLYFPFELKLAQSIANNSMLQQPYFKNRGITEAVAELAKEKLVDEDLVNLFAKLAAANLVTDLRTRNIVGEELSEVIWGQLIKATENALKDALNSTKK